MILTIYRKMVLGFAVIIGIMIAAQGYMLFELYTLSQEAQETLTMDVKAVDLAKRLRSLLDEEDSHARKYAVTRDKVYYELFQETSREFQKVLTSLVRTEAERGYLLHQVAERHHSLLSSLPAPDKTGRGPAPAGDARPSSHIEFIDRTLKGLIRVNQLSIDGAMTAFVAATDRTTLIAAALTLLTILTASATAWMTARTITRPIGRLVQATQQIARGQFEAIRVRSRDETALLAAAVNDMSARLKKVNEAKADLLNQIVHELRNPLQVIFFARNLLAEQELGTINGKQMEMLELISSNSQKLMNFTNQFLDLAKVDAGMMEYRRAPADLTAILSRAVDDARALAFQKDISIDLAAGPTPPIFADGDKLLQIFGNLLGNAVKYTEPGGAIEVAVSASGQKVAVTVRDSGIGIAAEELPKLFTKFYQAANASKMRSKGTGLGLALVKAFVDGHGGSVSVSSTPGTGSTFTVELPLMVAPAAFFDDAASP